MKMTNGFKNSLKNQNKTYPKQKTITYRNIKFQNVPVLNTSSLGEPILSIDTMIQLDRLVHENNLRNRLKNIDYNSKS